MIITHKLLSKLFIKNELCWVYKDIEIYFSGYTSDIYGFNFSLQIVHANVMWGHWIRNHKATGFSLQLSIL